MLSCKSHKVSFPAIKIRHEKTMAGGDPRVSESGNRHVANSQIH